MARRKIIPIILALAAALVPGPAFAATLASQDVDAIRQAAEALQTQAVESVAPLAPGDVKVMQAVVMSVTGRADWRPDARAQWKRAAVDDLLDTGAEIRTGPRARIVLRVGKNASVLVDRLSRVVLPQLVQVGDTLKTAVEVRRGRADFKVDRVGLTNDFSVVTPSTTLAVRGTGFAVQFGAFKGTEVASSRFNEIFAIEIRYFLTRVSFLLSGGSTSTEKHKNPALSALFQTFGPPPLISAVIEDADTPALLETALSGSPLYDARRVDISLSTSMETRDNPIFDEEIVDPPPPPIMDPTFDLTGFGQTGAAGIAEFICMNLFDIFLTYDGFMQEDFGGADSSGGFSFPGLNDLFFDINEFVCQGREQFVDEDLNTILEQVVAYCSTRFQQQSEFELCVTNFIDAGLEIFQQSPP